MGYRFVKGHGTENDFVVVPGDVELTPERVRALCDRRAGLGGDGVIGAARREGRWFMDYRNADGSVSEMCGNGIRVFARYLRDVEGETLPLDIDTRDGLKTLTEEGAEFTVDLGVAGLLPGSQVGVDARRWTATGVDMGNPHAVVFVDSLDEAGPLLAAPDHDPQVYPEGVNVEFVQRRGERHVAMRVHERGSGETRSCGTGAGAVMVASALADGVQIDDPAAGPADDTAYVVDVPGGRLTVTWTSGGRVLLTGPAVLVAEGLTDL